MASADLFKEVDKMHDDKNFKEIYEKLKPLADDQANLGQVEFKWRWARALFVYARELSKAEEKPLVLKAFDLINDALKQKEDSADSHKWCGIMLNSVSEYEGTKKRIENAYVIETHFKRAAELNPNDALTKHSLGVWHFEVTDLPWLQRKAASVIFAKPPESTYENALHFFLEAEKTSPGFYSMNVLFIGKTYVRMKKNTDAVDYLRRARDWPQKVADDKKARDEALGLLKQIGVKD